jgi:SAM-dependent methyltransferase
MYLAKRGLYTIGIDISIKKLKKGESGHERIRADACRLPFEAKVFDCVLCSEVLEHLVNPDQCISEIHRVLKDDSIACLTTPCLNIPIKTLIRFYRKFAGIDPELAREHLHVFSSKKLFAMLKPLFEIIDVRYPIFAFSTIERRLGIGYSFDRALSIIQRKMELLHYFAACVWIKVAKR